MYRDIVHRVIITHASRFGVVYSTVEYPPAFDRSGSCLLEVVLRITDFSPVSRNALHPSQAEYLLRRPSDTARIPQWMIISMVLIIARVAMIMVVSSRIATSIPGSHILFMQVQGNVILARVYHRLEVHGSVFSRRGSLESASSDSSFSKHCIGLPSIRLLPTLDAALLESTSRSLPGHMSFLQRLAVLMIIECESAF